MITEDNIAFYPNIISHLDYQRNLVDCLRRHCGKDSLEEDRLLDISVDIWHNMSPEERDFIKRWDNIYRKEIVMWREIDEARVASITKEKLAKLNGE